VNSSRFYHPHNSGLDNIAEYNGYEEFVEMGLDTAGITLCLCSKDK
jgi:hypothetical protein